MSNRDDELTTGSRNLLTDLEPSHTAVKERNMASSIATAEPDNNNLASRPSGSDAVARPRGNLVERIGQFISETRNELRKVDFPSATQVKNMTIITLITVIFFAVYLFAVDQTLTFIVSLIERGLAYLLKFVA